jgi:hypothetical protein
MHAHEVDALGDEIPMAGMFEVGLVDGVVDDALQVTLRVPHVELNLEFVVSASAPWDALCRH